MVIFCNVFADATEFADLNFHLVNECVHSLRQAHDNISYLHLTDISRVWLRPWSNSPVCNFIILKMLITSLSSLSRIGFMYSSTTSWTSASSLFLVCYYWTNWLIQVCLTSVVTTTIIRHTWINQVCPIMEVKKQGAGW